MFMYNQEQKKSGMNRESAKANPTGLALSSNMASALLQTVQSNCADIIQSNVQLNKDMMQSKSKLSFAFKGGKKVAATLSDTDAESTPTRNTLVIFCSNTQPQALSPEKTSSNATHLDPNDLKANTVFTPRIVNRSNSNMNYSTQHRYSKFDHSKTYEDRWRTNKVSAGMPSDDNSIIDEYIQRKEHQTNSRVAGSSREGSKIQKAQAIEINFYESKRSSIQEDGEHIPSSAFETPKQSGPSSGQYALISRQPETAHA